MLAETSKNATDHTAPPIEKETRFAVVMYGGVSLAIYIYGVAKELYNMVRATARKRNATADGQSEYLLADAQLTQVEKAYRRVGKRLGTKFVVDILSGTSAGGINAIYLAKALVNGESVDLLKDIWIEQGDIGKLINDRESSVTGLDLKDPPASLLNSQRMYFYLLKALHEMDTGVRLETPEGLSPFAEELDLNITATDIRGLTVALPISNAHVQEYRYRNVFRFHYSTMDAAGWEIEAGKKADPNKEYSNDFIQANNPFLAYAARCTSSFPFAFEPMQLGDIEDVLRVRDFGNAYEYKPEKWSGFYKDYAKVNDEFSKRSFGDGGYIDNKPFSYATEALLRRRAEQPVDRKLIYIDPSPEHPDTDTKKGEKPDALQNVLAALLSIPRYEPIREDLEKVIERNRLIQRVNEVIRHVDFVPKVKKSVKDWQKNPTLWANKYFDKELMDWFGISYATYHQLRVLSVIENLQSAILRAFNWEEIGTRADDLHTLVEGWRRSYYTIDPKLAETHWSENDILFRLDTTWRMRRLLFLQNIINKLLKAVYPQDESMVYAVDERRKAVTEANQILKTGGIEEDLSNLDADAVCLELAAIKREINDAYGHMRARGRKVRSQSLMEGKQTDADLQSFVNELSALKKTLEEPVQGRIRLNDLAKEMRDVLQTGSQPTGVLSSALEQIEKTINALGEHLPNKERKGYICQSLSLVGRKVKIALGSKPTGREKDKRTIIQRCLSYYHDAFEYYDMLIFPIYYGTDVGESDEAEIIRISPEDADSLFDEKKDRNKKLAGTTLANFGAFFAREWRENDMLWGRLDAAECVIKAMMPESDERDEMIRDVQVAILQEDLTARDEVAVYQARAKTDKAEREKLLTGKLKDKYGLKEGEADKLKTVLERLATPDKLLQLFKDGHPTLVDRSFPPKDTLVAGSRALRVLGSLLNGLSNTHEQFSTPARWLTSASSIFAGILAVTLPNSFGNFLFAGYWVWLLYVFEILLALAGWLFGSTGMSQIGVTSFVITFLVHLAVIVTNNKLAKRPRWVRLPLAILIGVLGIGVVGFVLFLLYVGLLNLGILQLPAGAIGEWLNQFQ